MIDISRSKHVAVCIAGEVAEQNLISDHKNAVVEGHDEGQKQEVVQCDADFGVQHW